MKFVYLAYMGNEINHIIHDYVNQNGIKKKWLADNLSVSQSWVTAMLKGKENLPDKRLSQINTLLKTDFQKPDPVPELLPHEQLEADKEKAKNLFKEP